MTSTVNLLKSPIPVDAIRSRMQDVYTITFHTMLAGSNDRAERGLAMTARRLLPKSVIVL